jgi:hypothetical protein
MNLKRLLGRVVARAVFVVLFALFPQGQTAQGVFDATHDDRSLIGLLPDSTVIAVEVRDVAWRWSEIRGVRAIARFQDRLFAGSALDADDLPRLAGDRAVLALVVAEDGRSVIPLALLRPPRLAEAAAVLEDSAETGGDEGPAYAVHRRRDTLWVAPAFAADQLVNLARGNGTSLVRSLPLEELNDRLPVGGLVRGWLNPAVLGDLLRNQTAGTRPGWVELLGAVAAAELDAVRFAGFRRELTPSGLITDAVVGYDTDILPPQVTRALDSAAAPSVLPGATDPGIVMMSSLRLEPEACLAWLRFAASRDPRGPLRNLDFWIAELEARTGLDIEHDLLGQLGEQGWLFVLGGVPRDTVRVVALLETRDASRVEDSLLRLGNWLREHVAGRSLGLTLARIREVSLDERTAHVLTIRSPLGEVPGPAFVTTGDHVVLGSGEQALRAGLRLLETKDTWRVAPHEPGLATPAHESLRVRGEALAPLVDAVIGGWVPERGRGLAAAMRELVADLDRASLDVWYEDDAVRLRSRIEFE